MSKLRLSLMVVILALIGLVGCYMLYAQKDANKALAPGDSTSTTSPQASQTTKKYTDTAKVYSLSYPSAWKVEYMPGGGEGATPDWAKTSEMVKFVPPGAPDDNGVTVQADTTGALEQQVKQSQSGQVGHPLDQLINGYNVKPVNTVFDGDAESYTDDGYLFTHNDAAVYITFREKYHHNSPAADWNAEAQLPAVKAIVNSVIFLN